ncbi:MAG: TolB family protein, partial [Spirochaetota bacterium]
MKALTGWGYENILNPVSSGKYVYYSSEYSGIDNIYALDTETGKRYQVTCRRFGAYRPSVSPDGKTLAFSDLDSNGYSIITMPLVPEEWTPLEKIAVSRVNYSQPLIEQEAGKSVLSDIPQVPYPSEKYRGVSRVFNVHSWIPRADTLTKDLTLQMTSQNLLGSFLAIGEYDYNWNEKTHAATAAVSYGGFYPVIDLSGTYGGRYVSYATQN